MAITQEVSRTTVLLNAVTTTGAGNGCTVGEKTKRTFQASGQTSAGAGAATVKVQVSDDGANWIDLGTITLTLATTAATDGFASDASWAQYRGNVTALSGTGAAVTLTMGA